LNTILLVAVMLLSIADSKCVGVECIICIGDRDYYFAVSDGCTTIVGHLYIFGIAPDITSLSALNKLENVTDYLAIGYNAGLKNLAGLEGLTFVGGYVNIFYNTIIEEIDGLSSLTSLTSYLSIMYNPKLSNVDGLRNIASSGGDINIGYNPAIINVDGLAKLTSISGLLNIGYNPALKNISGLSSVTSVGSINLSLNDALIELHGIQNVIVNLAGTMTFAGSFQCSASTDSFDVLNSFVIPCTETRILGENTISTTSEQATTNFGFGHNSGLSTVDNKESSFAKLLLINMLVTIIFF